MRIEPIAFLNAIRDPDRAKDNAFVTLFFVLAALSFSIAFFEFFSMVFIIFAAIAWWRDKRPGLFAEAAWIFLALYLGAALLSLTQTDYPQASWRGIFKVVRQAALCAGAFAVIDSPKKFKRIFVWLLIIGGVISADAVLQWLVGFDLIRSRRMTPFSAQTQRVTATFSHANDFASFLCIVTPCYLTVAAGGFKRLFSPKFSVIFYAGLVLSLAALLGTFSRGAWIAVAAAAVLLALLRPNRLLVALCLGVIVWMGFFSPPIIRTRLTTLVAGTDTVKERRLLWGESVRMIKQKPLFGWGINTYAKNEPNFKSNEGYTDNQYAHNGYLQIAAEIGLFGLAVFLAVIFLFLLKGFKRFLGSKDAALKSCGLGLTLGMVAFLIQGSTDTSFHSVLLINLFWATAGIMVAGSRAASR